MSNCLMKFLDIVGCLLDIVGNFGVWGIMVYTGLIFGEYSLTGPLSENPRRPKVQKIGSNKASKSDSLKVTDETVAFCSILLTGMDVSSDGRMQDVYMHDIHDMPHVWHIYLQNYKAV